MGRVEAEISGTLRIDRGSATRLERRWGSANADRAESWLANLDRLFQERRDIHNRALVARVNHEKWLIGGDFLADFFDFRKANREIDRIGRALATGPEQNGRAPN